MSTATMQPKKNVKPIIGQEYYVEEFVPTYELVLGYRHRDGKPTGKTVRFTSTNLNRLAGFYENHRRRNPLPKKQALQEFDDV